MQKAGKYEIVKKIGAGGFGVVYEGRDPFIQRRVAIKTCTAEDEDIRKRFFREAGIAGNLQHKNIVTIHDFGFEGDVPYLVQEYLSGEDLSELIARKEALTLQRKLDILLQAARGLDYAQERGVIHRDVKPGNVRLLEDGSVKIMDFGIARLAHVESALTKQGMTVGTAAYLPPEQIRGEKVDVRADLFSFGVTAYELLAYRRPFDGRTLSTMLYQILSQEAPALAVVCPGVPPRLEKLVGWCLQKEAARRCPSFAKVVEELLAVIAEAGLDRGAAPQGVSASGKSTAPSWAKPAEGAPIVELDRLIERGMSRLDDGEFADALRSFEAVLAFDPESTAGREGKVRAELGLAWLREQEPSSTAAESGAPEPSMAEVTADAESASADESALREPVATTAARLLLESTNSNRRIPTAPAAQAAAREAAAPPPARESERALAASAKADRARAKRIETAAGQRVESSSFAPLASPRARGWAAGVAVALIAIVATMLLVGREKPAVAPESDPHATSAPAPAVDERATPPVDDAASRAAILDALERYRKAYEALDAAAIREVWPALGDEGERRVESALASYASLVMTVEGCDVRIDAERATARCLVGQSIAPKSGRRLDAKQTTLFDLERAADGWVIIGLTAQ